MEVTDINKARQPGKFWQGILLSLAGWAMDVLLATVIYSVSIFNNNDSTRYFSIFTGMSGVFAILLAVIWVPVTIIAGIRSWKIGFTATIPLVLITSIFAPILIGCGFGVLVALYG
jgi:hypothetical protein